MPELIIGSWTKTSQSLWKKLNSKAKAQDVTILIGGKQWLNKEENQKEYISGLITIGKTKDKILLDRVPVPISMWRPWSKTKSKAKSFWYHPGIYYMAGKKVATIICYEQVLIWPVLHSLFYNPEIILVSSNVWWAKGTNISAIQQKAVKAFGRLFNIPILKAIDE